MKARKPTRPKQSKRKVARKPAHKAAAAHPKRKPAAARSDLARLRAERDEALEQQTATAEVLAVINASPGDLAPVFAAMVERAVRLCAADEALVRIFRDERLHLAAVHGAPGEAETLRQLGPAQLSGERRADQRRSHIGISAPEPLPPGDTFAAPIAVGHSGV